MQPLWGISCLALFWLHPKLYNFWNSIFKTLCACLVQIAEPGPVLAVLRVVGDDSPLRGFPSTVAMFITLLAPILLHWKKAQPLTDTMLIKDFMQHLKPKKTSSSLFSDDAEAEQSQNIFTRGYT